MTVEFRSLEALEPAWLADIVGGYTTTARYRVRWSETEAATQFSLELEALPAPRRHRYPPLDEATVAQYQALIPLGQSFAAFEASRPVGLAICEPQAWHNSLWVREFHVAARRRRQGIGRRLMEAVIDGARMGGFRVVVCETQSSNVPAIRFYRRLGFALEGVDLSYYANDDWPKGEVAVFMKRRLL